MRMKVSDYIARKLVDEGISDVFMVTGGGAMHLDDGLGHEPGLHCTFNHHEQACAIAAECYARIHNKIAAVCVTTGPGGTERHHRRGGRLAGFHPHADPVRTGPLRYHSQEHRPWDPRTGRPGV